MAQNLARHSDINLTMNVYTDVMLEDQAIAVELLPHSDFNARTSNSQGSWHPAASCHYA